MVTSTISHNDRGYESFTDSEKYKQIPSDVDYITLRFGINDCGYNVPLGSIDDETNETFYGSWNVVLRYLITNYPYAKIGTIISNGMQNQIDFVNAVINVSRKWGIPYLNIALGDNVPLMHRTNKDYVCQEAKDLRFNAFVIDAETDWHPNDKAQEYESTFIEAWLRTL